MDAGQDYSALAVFAEAEWGRVARVGEVWVVFGMVKVSEEGMIDASPRDLLGIEWRVKGLALALFGKPAPLRAMEEGEVHSSRVYPEVVEKTGRVGRACVGCPPEGQPVIDLDRPQVTLGEHMDVVAPLNTAIEAPRAVPVMGFQGRCRRWTGWSRSNSDLRKSAVFGVKRSCS